MNYTIEDVEGIGPAYAKKLSKAGIKTTGGLLKMCCDRKGRRQVAAGTGISEKLLLEWANLADLMRIKGIGPQYSELLEAAGVDTVKELRNRRPAALAAKLAEVQKAKRLTRTAPGASLVERWVESAKQLPPVISH